MLDNKYLSRLVLASLFAVFFMAFFLFFLNIPEKKEKSFWENEIKEVKIGKNVFQAEIAATPDKRSQGLSGRKELCENCAMLFIFGEKRQLSFWMKGMNFDLDMFWIAGDEIVYVAKDVSRKKELEHIKPEIAADKVLEINAGLADKLGIKVGDKVEF